VEASIMSVEMAEQPARLAGLIERRNDVATMVAPLLEGVAGTVIVARGSSDHAATTGRYLLEMATRRPVASASPSIQTIYRAHVDFSGYLVVAVSQSGRTPEIATYIERASEAGARTIAITNDPSSPLADIADAVVDLGAGEERAIPATKTVTAELVAFALLAAAAGEDPGDGAWLALPEQVASVLGDAVPMDELAEWLSDATRLATVARGPLAGAAEETALKLQETASLLATAFSAADLRHGPIVLASSGIRVLALAHPGPAADDVLDLCGQLTMRGADVRLLGPVPGAVCGWHAEAPEMLAPVLAVCRGQQLALALALRLGLDPDRPLGLSKVTAT
jgi:glucosamine--fructose-6-phosphate aminotransferase (isomerizing)